MQDLIQITAQVYENYSYAEGLTNWKPKGSQMFTMIVDAEIFLYLKDEAIGTIQRLLDKYSNKLCRFDYVSHEIIFQQPIALDGFEDEFNKLMSENPDKYDYEIED
jgi:hypothetical protein